MLGSVGFPELIIIFVIALLVFGPRRLPELGRSVGLAINEFKKGANDLRNSFEEEVRREEQSVRAAQIPPEAPAPSERSESKGPAETQTKAG